MSPQLNYRENLAQLLCALTRTRTRLHTPIKVQGARLYTKRVIYYKRNCIPNLDNNILAPLGGPKKSFGS